MTIVRGKIRFDVQPSNGVYLVTEMTQGHLRVFVVGKDKSCTCGGSANKQCCHVKAVASHLRRGGQRAPEKHTADPAPPSPPSPMACPICGAGVQKEDGSFWRCSEDSSHYWQWRGERSGIKDFLTKPHPAKQGAFYEQTAEERFAFLVAAQRRHAPYLTTA